MQPNPEPIPGRRFPPRAGRTLRPVAASLLQTFLTLCLAVGPASADHSLVFQQRAADIAQADVVGIHDCYTPDFDSGFYDYTLFVDDQVRDLLQARTEEGYRVTVDFAIRASGATLGKGVFQYDVTAWVNCGPYYCGDVMQTQQAPIEFTETRHYSMEVQPAFIERLSVGDVFTVTLEGSAQADPNGCKNIDQAAGFFRFHGGLPRLSIW